MAANTTPLQSFLPHAFKDAVHPGTHWAQSAGHPDWQHALEAMRAGKVLVGRVSLGGKTTLGITMLVELVEREGLHFFATEYGQLCIGEKGNFPQDILAMQDRQEERLAKRLQMANAG
jgi:hypothetical protein